MGTCASVFASFCAIVHFVRTISAKDFPHIYNGRNLRKTPPTVATEGRRTLILIYLCEEAVNQQEYQDWLFHPSVLLTVGDLIARFLRNLMWFILWMIEQLRCLKVYFCWGTKCKMALWMTDFKLDHRSSTSDDRGKKESQNHRSSRYSENNTLALTLTGPAFYGDQPHME